MKNYINFNEGLIMSWDKDIIIDKIENMDYFDINLDDKNIRLGLYKPFKLNMIDKLYTFLNVSGWYVSKHEWYLDENDDDEEFDMRGKPKKEDFNKYDGLDMTIVPKFTERVRIPKTMYHVTKNNAVEKIQKIGLIPKSNSDFEDYPSRVYLFDNSSKGPNDYMKALYYNYNIMNHEFTLLEIDTKNITKLYIDSEFSKEYGAFYTYENIPPSDIKIINKR